MINAEDHKKLVERIAELERDSVNYFDVEKEFFLITSDNLSEVQTRFYGYSIQATGIYEADNLTAEAVASLDGRGCYVYVEAKDGKITIQQDLNGCWGIYLFQQGDYFALSNSFIRLLEHVKFLYPLTVNRDYCHYLLVNGLCSHAYSETAVNEIRLLERNALVKIDIAGKNLCVELIDYKEHTLSLDTEEGVATLDRWFDFWRAVMRGISQHTEFIGVDLSGGFDSRIAFLIALHSGVALDKIQIRSIKSDLHVFPADYAIASKIAKHYGLKLNRTLPEDRALNYSLADVWNIDLYQLQTFHKEPQIFYTEKFLDKHYNFKGLGGETIRGYWHSRPKDFIRNQKWSTTSYSFLLSRELSRSMEIILRSAFRDICDKYGIEDHESVEIPQYLYQETRCRSHYGNNMLSKYFKNEISLSPHLDPELRTLRLNTPECRDYHLLIAFIFARYELDLLKFPFEGRRFIEPETFKFAQRLNDRFPRRALGNNNSPWGGGYVQFTVA